MREIKFRAWNPNHKTMHYPECFDFRFPILLPSVEVAEYWESASKSVSVTCELMQYTGLKDKNEKEIYEGDILRICEGVDGYDQNDWWNKYQVRMPDFYYSIEAKEFIEEKDFEIVGNIHENPDLL